MTTKLKLLLGICIVLLILVVGEILVLFFPRNSPLAFLTKYLPQPSPLALPVASPVTSGDLQLGALVTNRDISTFVMRVKLLKVYQDKDEIKASVAYNRNNGDGAFSESTILLGEIKPTLTPFSMQTQNIDKLTPTSDHIAPKIVKPVTGKEILTQLKPYINGILYIQFRMKTPPSIIKYIKKGNSTYDYYYTFLPDKYDCNMKFYGYLLNTQPLLSCLPFSDSLTVYVAKL